jgi:hypothetical protein
MSLAIKSVAMPRTQRTVASKYPFEQLEAGGGALVDAGLLDAGFDTPEAVEKAKSRLNSALVAYKARTGDTGSFSIRPFTQEDGSTAVGCWKVKKNVAATSAAPAAPAVEAEVAAEAEAEASDEFAG